MSKQPVNANLQLIYVSDIERSRNFYQTLLNQQPIFDSPRYVAFRSGKDTLFALWTGGTAPNANSQTHSESGIMLKNDEAVDKLHDEWQQSELADHIQAPYDEVFGRTFLVNDPDGHIIRVCPLDN